jgi:hypothetical protein
MSDDGGVKIVKVGQTPPLLKATRARLQAQSPTVVKHTSKHRSSQPVHGILKRGVTARTAPRFVGVRDPTSSPPGTTLRRSRRAGRSTRSSLRILTEHGARTRRASIATASTRKPIAQIREELSAHGLRVTASTPERLVRTIHKDAVYAGMISGA